MIDKYRGPGRNLFQSFSSQLTEEVDPNSIASDYFITIAPYIFPDAEKYHLVNFSEVIQLFLHGVLKQVSIRRCAAMFEQFAFYFPFKDVDKQIHLYLPDRLSESKERYPVLYMFDGHNLFFDEMATYGRSWDLLDFLGTYNKELIVVGIECSHEDGERLREYCPYSVDAAHFGQIDGYGDHFMDWLVNDLKPFIDDNYPTIAGRVGTAIAGSSMGGLMAYYGGVVHNETFSKAAALSPAFGFCFDELMAEFAHQQINPDTRIYFSFGDQEVNESRLDQASYLEQAILDRGGDTYMHLAAGGDHSEATWAAQNQLYMDFLWH